MPPPSRDDTDSDDTPIALLAIKRTTTHAQRGGGTSLAMPPLPRDDDDDDDDDSDAKAPEKMSHAATPPLPAVRHEARVYSARRRNSSTPHSPSSFDLVFEQTHAMLRRPTSAVTGGGRPGRSLATSGDDIPTEPPPAPSAINSLGRERSAARGKKKPPDALRDRDDQ
jgi:hypothetical protein